MKLDRPFPPPEVADGRLRLPELFVPAPEVWTWARQAFLDRASPLFNAEHGHFACARVTFLWTNVPNVRGQRQVVGTAEMPGGGTGPKWRKAREALQLREWFRGEPDFLVTLDAPHAAQLDGPSWCALVEHELYHCAQARDEWGSPKFTREGFPVWAIRGHDVEEFVGVVRRYGAGPAGTSVVELVEAAQRAPEVAPAAVRAVCGTCKAGVA